MNSVLLNPTRHSRQPQFSGTPQNTAAQNPEEKMKQIIYGGRFFSIPEVNFDHTLINTLVSQDKAFFLSCFSELNTLTPKQKGHFLIVAIIYCLSHPEETEILQKTLALAKRRQYRTVLETLGMFISSIGLRSNKNLFPKTSIAFSRLQKDFFLPILTDLAQGKKPVKEIDLFNAYIKYACFWRFSPQCEQEKEQTPDPLVSQQQCPLIPGTVHYSVFSKLLLPPQKVLAKIVQACQNTNANKGVLNDFTKTLVSYLAPGVGKAYLYKFYQNNYEEKSQTHPHCILLERLTQDDQHRLKITYLDNELTLDPKQLSWQGLFVDLRSGEYAHRVVYYRQNDKNNDTIKVHESSILLPEIFRNLISVLFGTGPLIGSGASVSSLALHEQDRSKASQYKFFGNLALPPFLRAAQAWVWRLNFPQENSNESPSSIP